MGHRDAMAGTPVTESARVSELVLLSERGQDTVTLCFLVPQVIEWGQNAYLFPLSWNNQEGLRDSKNFVTACT